MTSITVQQHACADCREYHTKAQLTERSIESSSCGIELGAVGEVVAALPGISQVFVRRYSVTVFKGGAWPWEEVEPAILDFLGAMK